MKLATLCLLAICSTPPAQADDSFTEIRNGKEYLCQPTALDPAGHQSCLDMAWSGPYTKDEAVRLCDSATNTSPAECGANAYSGNYTKEESIQLCIGATTAKGPVECATIAFAGPFSKDQTMQLCSKGGTAGRANCAIKAYQGPYSKDEAIKLCGGAADIELVSRALDVVAKYKSLVR